MSRTKPKVKTQLADFLTPAQKRTAKGAAVGKAWPSNETWVRPYVNLTNHRGHRWRLYLDGVNGNIQYLGTTPGHRHPVKPAKFSWQGPEKLDPGRLLCCRPRVPAFARDTIFLGQFLMLMYHEEHVLEWAA